MTPDPILIETLSEEKIADIEWNMRSGRSSRAGFLGPEESLRQVIRDDDRTLRELGVSHDQIARRLVEIVREGMAGPEALSDIWLPKAARSSERLPPVHTGWSEMAQRKKTFEAQHKGETWPGPSSELDCFRLVLEAARPRLLTSGFGFTHIAWKGFQYCPFGEQLQAGHWPPCGGSGSDFLITNPRRREWIVFSGLLPHLIEAHHFFEGRGSVYRLDPELTVRVLELGQA